MLGELVGAPTECLGGRGPRATVAPTLDSPLDAALVAIVQLVIVHQL
jgi:hypothetical protein